MIRRPSCIAINLAVTASRARSRGVPNELLTDANWDRVEHLEAVAADHGLTLLELAFAWLLSQAPVASVIAGATTPEQVRANAATAGVRLDAATVDGLR